MKKASVIPAMDLIDGHCVRLKGGDFDQRTDYSSDPVQIAKQFEVMGFSRLHMVDLDGAKSGSPKHLDVLEKVAGSTKLIIDYSGGIKTADNLKAVFDKGAAMSAIGSVAVNNTPLFLEWLNEYGPQRILLGLDVRKEQLAIRGWLEQTDISIFSFLKEMVAEGVQQIFCTDIGKDGMMSGPSIQLYQRILSAFPKLHLIASGGVSTPRQLEDLAAIGVKEAIVGKALYENFNQLDQWI